MQPFTITSFDEYKKEYQKSVDNPESFWEEYAETFNWHEKWDNVHSGSFEEGNVKWFEGGKLNITENCLDRHLEEHGDKVAFYFEPNKSDDVKRSLTFNELHEEVCKFANVLESKGIGKGDRVAIYMAMTPELAIAALACARVGAVHSIVFAGFSANSLANRIQDCEAKMLITNDGLIRGEKLVRLKDISDKALQNCPTVENVIVRERTQTSNIGWDDDRDEWWDTLMKDASPDHEAVPIDAEDPLFILYTSGSTGKPKGQVHTCGGYMVYASYTMRNVFQPDEEDVYWCTADAGWITGHTYIIYGPLLNAVSGIIFESTPTYPDPGRLWKVVEKYEVNQFYTSPTAIRALMNKDIKYVKKYDLSSLKVLGSVGEPINEEAWNWYNEKIGHKDCPIVDTWWQTETGGIMISPVPDVTPTKPGFATLPLPGIQPALVDDDGNEIEENGSEGNLVIKKPWPGVTRDIWGNHERYMETYFNKYPGYYLTGDGCRRDEDGYYRITGRIDDVLNVSGHRLGTAEIEDAIDDHKRVVESAVVGAPHEVKGEAIYAFVIPEHEIDDPEAFKQEINKLITKAISPIAKVEKVQVVGDLPKTRSGKIMRRILRLVAADEAEELGDTSTLLNPHVVEEIKEGKAY
ncbi:MAG TPA: acetate--CoA ligase [Balneolaceae bacterium]|nr:acetate--CoA ligase [Balneolaceae bacterium]